MTTRSQLLALGDIQRHARALSNGYECRREQEWRPGWSRTSSTKRGPSAPSDAAVRGDRRCGLSWNRRAARRSGERDGDRVAQLRALAVLFEVATGPPQRRAGGYAYSATATTRGSHAPRRGDGRRGVSDPRRGRWASEPAEGELAEEAVVETADAERKPKKRTTRAKKTTATAGKTTALWNSPAGSPPRGRWQTSSEDVRSVKRSPVAFDDVVSRLVMATDAETEASGGR